MTLTEMAAKYGLKDSSALRHAIKRGVLKAEYAGKTYFVAVEDAEEYARDHLRKRGPRAEKMDGGEP